tara:strand:+ start:156 stop:476 length:321 start_codon:yes stop_codon:yes gene_type:complete
MTDKNYDLYSIEKDLIEELEDNQEEILEHDGDNLHEIVDSNISVYTYDQIMIYANNNKLWGVNPEMGGETIQEQIVSIIFEHLSGVAHQWLYQKQKELEELEATND